MNSRRWRTPRWRSTASASASAGAALLAGGGLGRRWAWEWRAGAVMVWGVGDLEQWWFGTPATCGGGGLGFGPPAVWGRCGGGLGQVVRPWFRAGAAAVWGRVRVGVGVRRWHPEAARGWRRIRRLFFFPSRVGGSAERGG